MGNLLRLPWRIANSLADRAWYWFAGQVLPLEDANDIFGEEED